ncbi:Chloroperoxidase, partial [Phaeosphaeriaceae sp. PMI808]
PWHPPGPSDVRSPCPMLNALANHGILPHDGKKIGLDNIINALTPTLNFDVDFSKSMHKLGLTTVLDPNATTFDLDGLNRHDIVEVDASLSRGDFYFGDNHSFNRTIWRQSLSYWKRPIIDISGSAAAVAARVRTSQATNPSFSLVGKRLPIVAGGAAFFTTVLGNHATGTVDKNFVRELFEHERLPIAQGWSKS